MDDQLGEKHGSCCGGAPLSNDGGREGMKGLVYYIDVFSSCNLRCPSCYVGSDLAKAGAARGLMRPQLLEAIISKAKSETDVRFVGLYNWTEPLLHPEISELVGIVKSAGVKCHLSTNLNVLREPEKLMAANPDWIRISLSGFSQPVYQIGHKSGDIEKVKANMVRLARARSSVQCTTDITVFYHRYVYNRDEEAAMADLARSLGFGFDTINAYVTTVEKIIAIARGRITKQDAELLERLVIPLDQALSITSRTMKADCVLLEDVMALDVNGDVFLCCGCSAAPSNRITNFLDMPFADIQAKRRMHRLCGPCLKLGIPDYYVGDNPKLAEMARRSAPR